MKYGKIIIDEIKNNTNKLVEVGADGKLETTTLDNSSLTSGSTGTPLDNYSDTVIADKNVGDVLSYQDGDWVNRAALVKNTYLARYKQSNGVAAGTSVAGAWQTLTLNDVQKDQDWASLSSNVITLQKGKYAVIGMSPHNQTRSYQNRFYKTSGSGTAVVHGMTTFSRNQFNVYVNNWLGGVVEITSNTADYEFQYYVSAGTGTNGLGVITSFTADEEVYNSIRIIRIQ